MKKEGTEPKQVSQETESLVKRLAGPSTGKAGLAKDQTEINRIIADASKGSKFYENEKRKDKELTEHIQRILKQRDEVMKGADINRIEALVDRMLSEIEAQRDLSQIIVHVDMDAFFANVELLFNPELKDKPFGVGRGVLSTASYEARKYGVRSGMPSFIAKKLCPDLILISLNFSRYTEMSGNVMAILKTYDPNMSIAGCDEGYLNITSYCQEHGLTGNECVAEMRSKVFEVTKLTASAGIAPNKMLAKICSDKNKPNGQFHLPFDAKSITEFMRDLPIRKIPGVGRVNERLLDSIGIKTCGDIFTHRAVVYLMDKHFGLAFLSRTYLGIASNVVQAHQREERKEHWGREVYRTFTPLADKQKILEKLEEIAEELEEDMETNGWTGKTVTLKYKLDTYQVFTRAKSTNKWIKKKDELLAIGKELLMPEFPLRLRLIGLRVTKLKDLRTADNTGIKRVRSCFRVFFGPVDSNSPRKRRKIDGPEHDEDEDEPTNQSSAVSGKTKIDVPKLKPRPPVSAPARSFPSVGAPQDGLSTNYASPADHETRASKVTQGAKPASAASSSSSKRSEPLRCPVCDKTILTDNEGLNAHIDFCLSRSAIREAQAESIAGTSTKRLKPSQR
ncbi:DNA/RNA polymerase [Amanita rubescens]|nr:DNA/RNA polymerase [Amanita rubescens]